MDIHNIDSKTVELLKNAKGLILDGDGVFFSVHESRFVMPDKTTGILKSRSLQDGQGLSYLRQLGLKVLFATGEAEPLPTIVKKLNELPMVKDGRVAPVEYFEGLLGKSKKVEAISLWLEKHGLTWAECVYVGDDMTDYEAMRLVGLPVTPLNGTRRIREIAKIVLTREGGNGAIRELAELVLDARGVNETTLSVA